MKTEITIRPDNTFITEKYISRDKKARALYIHFDNGSVLELFFHDLTQGKQFRDAVNTLWSDQEKEEEDDEEDDRAISEEEQADHENEQRRDDPED